MTNFDKNYSVSGVNFNYSRVTRKWEFNFQGVSGANTLLVPAGGKDKAHKVASIVAGAVKRSGGMDGLARANIARVLA